MISTAFRSLSTIAVAALVVAACGGGDESSDDLVFESDAESGIAEIGADPDDSVETDVGDLDVQEAEGAEVDGAQALPEAGDDVVDPVFHHVSAVAPPGSWGPLCNTDNQDEWAPGWRITVPEDWRRAGTGGSSSFYDIRFETTEGFEVVVDWTESVESFGFTEGAPVGEADFDGEAVTVMDHSDDTTTIFSMDFIVQSAGGVVEFQGSPSVHQVAVSSPGEMGMTQDEATEILTSMQRERCAILDAMALENAIALAVLLPEFEGGDPLGKTPPSSDRLSFDPTTAIMNPASSYTDDQLAYIVGFDQPTSECFVAQVRPTLPNTLEELVAFADPITPNDEDGVAAMEAVLATC